MGQGCSMREAGAVGRDEFDIARARGPRKHCPGSRKHCPLRGSIAGRFGAWVPRISGTNR